MAEKRVKGRIFSGQPNKFLLKRLILKGKKKRLKGRIFSVKPNKYMRERERAMENGKKWRLKEEEDMMSKLPDEILVSIMFCLTMKEAAKMSLVCRRWQKIWNTTIPVTPRLTFDVDEARWSWTRRESRYSTTDKIDVLNNVVKMHNAPTLDEFSLIASAVNSKHFHHLNTWIDFAAKKHVKKLTLNICPVMYYDASFVADNFHCLRELYLKGIDVTENFIHRLFSNSPFLERFSLLNSGQLHKLNIASAPNLKYLKIESCYFLRHLVISSSVPNLNTMEIRNAVSLECVNTSAPNLSHLILGDRRGFIFDSYLTLLDQIKRLTLDIEDFVEVISDQLTQFPQFSKVEHLELKMSSYSRLPIHRLPDLLKAAPLLKTFSFQEYKFEHPAKDSGLKWLDKHIPSKVGMNHKYLKVVKFDIFAGCQYEVEFLLHILEYAVSLEKIIIQLMPSKVWTSNIWRNEKGLLDYEGKFDNQYALLCFGCAQSLNNRISQMHPNALVIIT